MSADGRIKAFDWLRGLAVLVMVQTHAVSLLRPELRAVPSFRPVEFIDGLVAPAFLFAAGFSLSLVQVRAARGGGREGRLRKSLIRIAEVLAVAVLINALWFPITREPHWLWRFDILHCVGTSLLLALPVVWLLAARPLLLALALGGLSAAAFALAPYAEGVTGPLARLFTEASGSQFPVAPWLGHVLLGASIGALAGVSRKALLRGVGLALGVGLLVWKLSPLIAPLYPAHALWRIGPGPHALRFALVAALALSLLGLERWLAGRQAAPVRLLELFGQSSLAAYVFHLLFLYWEPIPGASFRAQWGHSLDYVQLAFATLALLGLTWAATLAMVRAQQRLEKESADPLRLARPPFLPHEEVNGTADGNSSNS